MSSPTICLTRIRSRFLGASCSSSDLGSDLEECRRLKEIYAMTKDEEARVFRLLDGYSRHRHNCFVAEFFVNRDQPEYIVCFRPLGGTKESPNRYACVYVTVALDQVKRMAADKALTAVMAEELDRKLAPLGQLR
jgi:hypothetical protein